MGAALRLRQARIRALQSVYAVASEAPGGDLAAIAESIPAQVAAEEDQQDGGDADLELLQALLAGFGREYGQAAKILRGIMEASFDSISQIERAVLMLAVVEMLARPDTPRAVVINEWMEVTKQFGSPQGHKLVNAILDSVPAAAASK